MPDSQDKAEIAPQAADDGPLLRDETHHARILREVRDRIVSGEWEPGQRIPYEAEMATSFGVSRMTVNKVLTQLTREGYLERRRKAGTIVRLPKVQSAVLEIVDIEREITALGRAYAYHLVEREVRPATEAERAALDLRAGQRVLRLTCLHVADGLPFCAEERIVNLQAVPAAEDESFDTTPPGGWLLRLVPWSGAHHVISATGARAALARILEVKPGTPCLEILRTTVFDSARVTQARLTYPGFQHQLVADFAP